MARARIFVSSTYYDLKHIRSSLDNFIESLGFESILSEKGDIAYSPEAPLDESCYREATNADIFVLILGGRYGSASSATDEETERSHSFFDRYDSITKKEYEAAVESDTPTYILIEANVYSEYHTYLRNKSNEGIQYAHVDSVNIFKLIEEILAKPRNNPVHAFERFSDIEGWLREQWSGLFRELLTRMTGQQQITNLSAQVDALAAINETLQRYLEAVVTKVSPENAAQLIDDERRRLSEVEQLKRLRTNTFYVSVIEDFDVEVEEFRKALLSANTYEGFLDSITRSRHPNLRRMLKRYQHNLMTMGDLNDARRIVGKEPFPIQDDADEHDAS